MLHEQTNNNGLFLSIKHGAICLEAKDAQEGYELVEGEVDGRPYAKYVKKFGGLSGYVNKIEWYERAGDYGTFRGLKLSVTDNGEHYILDLPFEKKHYDYFTKVAENIDFSKPLEFVAWPDRKNAKNGHTPTAFGIKQDGQFVQWKYTKDNPGECPPAKQLRTGKWSFDEQREWLLDRVLTVVAPRAASAVIPEPTGISNTPEFKQEVAKAVGASIQVEGSTEPHPSNCNCDACIPF